MSAPRDVPIESGMGVDDDSCYRELRGLLDTAGCFKLRPLITTIRISALVATNVGGYLLLLSTPAWPVWMGVLAVLASSHAQCGFVAHDSVHGTIARKPWLAELVGQSMTSFFNGLSYAYFFKHNHRHHHPYCGDEARDPEMQWGLFALSEDDAQAKTGFSRHTSRQQAWLIWIMLTLNAFVLRGEGLRFVRQHAASTRNDQLALVLHFAVWVLVPTYVLGTWVALLNYMILTWFIGIYLTGIFPFYHVGCSTFRRDDAVSPFRRQIEGTRNMTASWLAELYSGGTNNHIEHHLFPAIPTARLRRARQITRAFCKRRGIPYREMNYGPAIREITAHMFALSRKVPAAA